MLTTSRGSVRLLAAGASASLVLLALVPPSVADDRGAARGPGPVGQQEVGAGMQAGVPAFQSARNRQVKTRKVDYVRVCPDCVSGQEVPASFHKKQAKARIKVTTSTYKILDHNDKFDFFIVDVSSELTKRKGDQDWGWYDVTVTSVGKTKILGSSYSEGKDFQNVDRCKRFPVNLGVGYYGVSVGTTVGHVSFCHDGSRMVRTSVRKGQKYHATGVTGIRSLQGQRYVKVKQGRTPNFKVRLVTNKDRFFCYTAPDGTHCRVDHGMQSKSLRIGTTRQK